MGSGHPRPRRTPPAPVPPCYDWKANRLDSLAARMRHRNLTRGTGCSGTARAIADRLRRAGRMKRYRYECPAFKIEVEIDDDGIIRQADPMARRFLGRHMEMFITWVRKYAAVETRVTAVPPKLFD